MTEAETRAQPAAGVLLVDDDEHILSAIRRTLRRRPWKLHTANCGEAGLKILEGEQLHVVLSDYLMPGMDGVEFLSRVKERWPDVQRVMLTGQADRSAIERAINESEVLRFLNKPWHDSQLIATIQECIERKTLLESNHRYRVELAERNAELEAINRDLEKVVQERTRALIQAEKMAALGRMSGGIAHEINNPLGGLLAFVQVLQRDFSESDSQLAEGLNTIQDCALRCKSIVDNLLSFSRRPSGNTHDELQINQVVQAALVIARLHPRAKTIPLRLELAKDIPPIVGHAGLLEQVLVNLIQNAYQASPPGQEVTLRTAHLGDEVLLEVQDRGAGIPDHILPRIFEPFFTTKKTGEGTGLGLFICYGIAREHGGLISVQSDDGKGSTFTLRLPVGGRKVEKESAR